MFNKKLKSLEQLLNQMVSEKKLSVENRDKLAKAMKKLSHAIDTRNLKSVKKAVGEVCEILICINCS